MFVGVFIEKIVEVLFVILQQLSKKEKGHVIFLEKHLQRRAQTKNQFFLAAFFKC